MNTPTDTPTDTQLKQVLAKMLPEKVTITHTMLWCKDIPENPYLMCRPILDTELLHLCWLVEETLTELQALYYNDMLNTHLNTQNYYKQCHTSWQKRTIALSKVKGIEI